MARLSKAPVCFTLAQMRFNPVLDMNAFLPALQDDFRKAGYPDYEPANVHGFEFQQAPDGLSFSQKAVIRHVFCNKGKTAAIVLDPAALTYELTDYPIFEDFSACFLRALKIVHVHRPIDYCDRLGMRMLDAVQPIDGEGLDKYVVPQAFGFTGLIDKGVEHQQTLTESLFKIDHRTLLVRTICVSNGFFIPVDLAPLRLHIAPQFLRYVGETIILDSDCFQNDRSDFSVEVIGADLQQLKLLLARSFKGVVTPHALKVWE